MNSLHAHELRFAGCLGLHQPTIPFRGTEQRQVRYRCSRNFLILLVGVRRFELPAPASRRHQGIRKWLLMLGILETPVDTSA